MFVLACFVITFERKGIWKYFLRRLKHYAHITVDADTSFHYRSITVVLMIAFHVLLIIYAGLKNYYLISDKRDIRRLLSEDYRLVVFYFEMGVSILIVCAATAISRRFSYLDRVLEKTFDTNTMVSGAIGYIHSKELLKIEKLLGGFAENIQEFNRIFGWPILFLCIDSIISMLLQINVALMLWKGDGYNISTFWLDSMTSLNILVSCDV
ncbi:hypothetical protein JTB14_021516 [Gonioctena quinquepunctata]|nr:hypothetical protein JTB14_021516 [Gonioctena quinquepunctata]